MTTAARTPSSPTPAEVKAARVALGLTQTQAAAIIGYSKRGWQGIEAGDRAMRPSAWELFQLKTKGE
jgi:DNA-binding XRE family transcriptional regulator